MFLRSIFRSHFNVNVWNLVFVWVHACHFTLCLLQKVVPHLVKLLPQASSHDLMVVGELSTEARYNEEPSELSQTCEEDRHKTTTPTANLPWVGSLSQCYFSIYVQWRIAIHINVTDSMCLWQFLLKIYFTVYRKVSVILLLQPMLHVCALVDS